MTEVQHSTNAFVVRPATQTDHAALSRLFDAYRQFYGKAADISVANQFIADRLRNGDSTILVAAAGDGQLAGFAQLYPTFSSVSARAALVLNDVFVDTPYRKAGVGRLLVKASIAAAESKQAAWVALQTAKTNVAAQSLYRSLGFVRDDHFDVYEYVIKAPTAS